MTFKPELLLPAGNLEKLKFAIAYGADAVYLGTSDFSLRTSSDDFSPENLSSAIDYAHQKGIKVYLTANIFLRNEDIASMEGYLKQVASVPFDAIIISDPAALELVQECLPKREVHLSTQANTTNWRSVRFWQKLGVKRIILARELSLKEIAEIHQQVPDMELEAFVHGSMCMAYSGRCVISNYMTNRDANHGECSQSCRWSWEITEEKRPGESYRVEEDQHGTYLFNSKDLCLVEHLRELKDAGVTSFKVEGRSKSIYYLTTAARVYREAIDTLFSGPGGEFDPRWMEELLTTANRGFTEGFLYGKYSGELQNFESSTPSRSYDFLAVADGYDPEHKMARFVARNRINGGSPVEIVTPAGKKSRSAEDQKPEVQSQTIPDSLPYFLNSIYDANFEPIPHVNTNGIFYLEWPEPLPEFSLIRKKAAERPALTVISNIRETA